jgi:hypothetical protein
MNKRVVGELLAPVLPQGRGLLIKCVCFRSMRRAAVKITETAIETSQFVRVAQIFAHAWLRRRLSH